MKRYIQVYTCDTSYKKLLKIDSPEYIWVRNWLSENLNRRDYELKYDQGFTDMNSNNEYILLKLIEIKNLTDLNLFKLSLPENLQCDEMPD